MSEWPIHNPEKMSEYTDLNPGKMSEAYFVTPPYQKMEIRAQRLDAFERAHVHKTVLDARIAEHVLLRPPVLATSCPCRGTASSPGARKRIKA
jgi:hypothetical protein